MKKYLYITIATGFAFILAGLLIFQAQRITALETAMEGIYLSALHQTSEEMDALTLDMEKALLTTDAVHAITLLHHIGQSAGSVQQSLSLLPVEPQALQPALRFANQLADDSASLLSRLAASGQLTEAERAKLNQQLALCSQLSSQLALAESVEDLDRLTLDAANPSTPSIQQPRGLPEGEITQQEAIDIARSFVGDSRVTSVQAAPGTSGTLAAYGVTVQAGNVQLNMEVTRQGGKVLWMMPETASFAVTQSPQACRDAAATFLALRGFGDMEAVHHQVYDGLCVVSLVPLQDGVLLYPDVVKVQVRMDTGEVVGLEAHNYWLNHVRRELPAPTLTQADAQAHISDHAAVQGIRLCVIPMNGSEILCYEISILHNGETYLIYIDARSGQEVELLKTVLMENGSLTA